MTRHPALRDTRGFTLVELMVVIFVMGLLASVAVLSMPAGSGAVQKDAARFAARTAALRDNAILQSRPMAVQVTPSGYAFLERRDGNWQVIEDKPFVSTDWSAGVVADTGESGPLLIGFENTGLPADAVTVRLTEGADVREIQVAAMGDVQLGEATR